jgi:site-specific DNA recombinase
MASPTWTIYSEIVSPRSNPSASGRKPRWSGSKAQSEPQITLEPDQLKRFGTFMREKITVGETSFRRAYLRAVVEAVEVDDHVIRIHGSKTSLEQAVVAGEQIGKGVRGFIRKWRAQRESNPCFRRERATS